MGLLVVSGLILRCTALWLKTWSSMLCLLPPGLYFSIKNGSIWPAWPDILSGVEMSHSPRTSILMVVEKKCFSGTCFFCNFSQNCLPKWLPKVTVLCYLELQNDALSLFRCIFGHLVFERPYSDLSVFSHVSGTRKLKKTCKKAVKTVMASHPNKNTPGNHAWKRKCQKIEPGGRSRPWVDHFRPGGPFGDTWALKSQNTRSGHEFLGQVLKMYH